MAAPFGACGVTALLTWLTTGGQGDLAANLKVAADMVDLGAAIYGMVAVTIEGGVRRMFWAWEKHQAVKESLREEGREEGRQEGRKENRGGDAGSPGKGVQRDGHPLDPPAAAAVGGVTGQRGRRRPPPSGQLHYKIEMQLSCPPPLDCRIMP